MRATLPGDFVLALRAPRHAVVSARGPLRPDTELEAGLEWLKAAADAVQARAVIIHTPAELTPGARSRDLLREYVARLPRVPGRHYVWAAQGAWEPEEAQRVCDELGLCRAFDPLESRAIASPVVYATLRALGHRAGFSYASLGDAVARTLEHAPEEAFISVDAERGFDIARRLRGIATQEAAVSDAAEAPDDDELDDEDDAETDTDEEDAEDQET